LCTGICWTFDEDIVLMVGRGKAMGHMQKRQMYLKQPSFEVINLVLGEGINLS
jgi:hypothetical protein